MSNFNAFRHNYRIYFHKIYMETELLKNGKIYDIIKKI